MPDQSMSGRIWTPSPSKQIQNPPLDGCKSEAKEKMPYRRPGLVKCWYVCRKWHDFNSHFNWFTCFVWIDYLQARLTLEISQPAFSELPFRFAEVAKVILDVLVLFSFFFLLSQMFTCVIQVLQTISKIQKNFVHSWKTFVKPVKRRVEMV